MAPVPNQVYTAFSFVGFILCAVPFYWHLEGTSKFRYMFITRGSEDAAVQHGTPALACTWPGRVLGV